MVAKKLKTLLRTGGHRPQLVVALLLALAASGVSLAAAAYVGWTRGVDTPQKIVMSCTACITVFVAHFLLTLLDRRKTLLSIFITVVWLACSVFLIYGHTQLFLLAQKGVGDARVDQQGQLNQVVAHEPDRKLSRVLAEKTRVQSSLANLNACQSNCERFQGRREFLKGQLEVLLAEEREWARWEYVVTRAEQAKQRIFQDQALTQASQVLNVRYDALASALGLLFSMTLEGVAAVCWYYLLSASRSAPTLGIKAEVTNPQAGRGDSVVVDGGEDAGVRDAVEKVKAGLLAGNVSCTVKSIRNYLGCAQEKASKVRRLLAAESSLQLG